MSGATSALSDVALVWLFMGNWMRGPSANRFLHSPMSEIYGAAKRGELQEEARLRSPLSRTIHYGGLVMIAASIIIWLKS